MGRWHESRWLGSENENSLTFNLQGTVAKQKRERERDNKGYQREVIKRWKKCDSGDSRPEIWVG